MQVSRKRSFLHVPSKLKLKTKLIMHDNAIMDIGINPTLNMCHELDIMCESATPGEIYSAGIVIDQRQVYRFFNHANQFYWDYDGRIYGGSWPNNERLLIEIGNWYVKKNGTTVISGTTKTSIKPQQHTLHFLGTAIIHLWSLKIYSDSNKSTLLHYYVPATYEEIPCLWDIVEKRPIYNTGTGEITVE